MSRHIPIAELADLLHVRSNPWKAMALLRAFFDESGTDQTSPVVAVGGLISVLETWKQLEGDWLAELSRFASDGFPVAAFHSAECEEGTGAFFGMQKPIRDTFPKRLGAIVMKYRAIPIWSAVVTHEWGEVTNGEHDFLMAYPHPFYFCFETCAQHMTDWSNRHAAGSPIALVYSEQKEFEKRVRIIWDAYSRAKRVAPLSSFTTTSYRDCVPLQAADLVAFESYKQWADRTVRRPAADVLIRGSDIECIGCHTKETIQRAIDAFNRKRGL